MTIGLKVDDKNEYQQIKKSAPDEIGYEFDYSIKVSAVNHEGVALTSSKSIKAKNDNNYSFVAKAAGVYTVEYKVEVTFEDAEYGFYTPAEVEEEYVVTKTYTVNKAEMKLSSTSDAYIVSNDLSIQTGTQSISALKAVDDDYSVSVDVTSCLGTEVGEFPLSITIKYEGEEIAPEDILLQNYYVTVAEGTRYILSAEDVAKVNVVRKLADLQNNDDGWTIEYLNEKIALYNALSAGQKLLAAIDTAEMTAYESKLTGSPIETADIQEDEYNLARADKVADIKAAITAYQTASVDTKKAAALSDLANKILALDNTAHKYGSDTLYVLNNVATTKVEIAANATIAKTDIFTATIVKDADSKYNVSFGYDSADGCKVNDAYDAYLKAWNDAYGDNSKGFVKALTTAEAAANEIINQTIITDLSKALATLESKYDALIGYQVDYTNVSGDGTTFSGKVSTLHKAAVADATKIIERWNAYEALIESYEFESTYVANKKVDTSRELVKTLLGYDFANASLNAYIGDSVDDVIELNDLSLSNMLFLVDDEYATPNMFVDGVISATAAKIDLLVAVQAEVNKIQTDFVQYMVDNNIYLALDVEGTYEDFDAYMESLEDGGDADTYLEAFETAFEDDYKAEKYPNYSNLTTAEKAAADADIAEAGYAAAREEMFNYMLSTCGSYKDLNYYTSMCGMFVSYLTVGGELDKDIAKDGFDAVMAEEFEDVIADIQARGKQIANKEDWTLGKIQVADATGVYSDAWKTSHANDKVNLGGYTVDLAGVDFGDQIITVNVDIADIDDLDITTGSKKQIVLGFKFADYDFVVGTDKYKYLKNIEKNMAIGNTMADTGYHVTIIDAVQVVNCMLNTYNLEKLPAGSNMAYSNVITINGDDEWTVKYCVSYSKITEAE